MVTSLQGLRRPPLLCNSCNLFNACNPSTLRCFARIFYALKEILEERVINSTAFRVILHREPEWIFLQANLLDDAIVSRPGFHFQVIAQPIDCLVMGAVHF